MKHIQLPFKKSNPAQGIRTALVTLVFLLTVASAAQAKTYTVAYFEAGDYPYHRALQREVREQLEKLTPAEDIQIIYASNGYKSAEWDRKLCKRMARQIVDDPSIDLVMAMGPWAVEDLLAAGFRKPILAMGRFDPTLEGLTSSDGKPLHKNLTVRIRPAKIETDLAVLKAVYPSAKRIGILYFQSGDEFGLAEGFFRQKAERLGLSIVTVPPDPGEVNYLFFKKISQLSKGVDALYLTPLYGMQLSQITSFFEELKRKGIPVFGSEGYYQLERGAFATNSSYAAASVARFHADKLIKILKGARPSSLPTVFREGRRLGINLEACDRAGIVPAPHLISEARLIERKPDPSVSLYTVESAISEAKRVNPQVLARAEALSSARTQASGANSSLLPRLSADAYINKYDADPPVNALRVRTEGKSGYQLTVNQTLFDWRAFKSSSVASATLTGAELGIEDQNRRLEFAIASEFMALQVAKERSQVIADAREMTHRAQQIAMTGYLLGQVERIALIRWESRKEKMSFQVMSARQAIKSSEIAFLGYLGRSIGEPFTIDHSLYPSGTYDWRYQRPQYLRDQIKRAGAERFWINKALENSPDLRAARSEVVGARAELSAQKGDFLPSIEAYAGYFNDDQYATSAPLDDDDQGWIVGARLKASLFDGGRAFKRRSQLKTELTRSEYQVDQALVEVSTRVQQAFAAFLGAYDRSQFAVRRFQLVTETLEESFSAYELGKIGLAEMADEIEQTMQARLGLTEAVHEFHTAKHALYYSAGISYITPRSPQEDALFESIEAFLSR